MKFNIHREEEVVASVYLEGSWITKVMGEDLYQASWRTGSYIEFQKGDHVFRNGLKYVLSGRPNPKEVSTLEYQYVGNFEADHAYSLIDTQYFMYDQDSELTLSEFSLTGKPSVFLNLLIKNANRRSKGWSLGTVDDFEAATLSFSDDDNCRTVLTKLAEQFKTEFWFDGKTIHLTKKGEVTALKFAYGHGKGLYEVNAITPDDFQLITKLYYFGGDRNLPVGYRKNSAGVASRKLLGSARFIQADVETIRKYGIIERSKTFTDIIPERVGVITALGEKPTIIIDESIDFDINKQLQPGITAKISFTTGQLAGYEFEINNYKSAVKSIEFNIDKNELAFGPEGLPNQYLKPTIGDKYVLYDIQMPVSDVTNAENRLDDKALEFLNEHKEKPVKCEVVCSPAYFQQNNLSAIKIGDYVTIISPVLGGEKQIRIIGITVDLQNPWKIVLELADEVTINQIVRSIIERDRITNVISLNKLDDVIRARRNTKTVSELQNYVVDPEGNYYTEKIKAGSIETLYFSTGAKATNFSLRGVGFEANSRGDSSVFKVTAGQLVHFALDIPAVGFVWNMSGKMFSDLVPAATYYVYARVSRTSLVGAWVLSENIITAEQEAGFWHLQSGVLFAVNDGRRDHEFTKGMTFIIGDQIKAGLLASIDGLNFFNLTTGQFNMGSANAGIDWDVTNPNKLTIRGGLVQNSGGITNVIALYRGVYNTTSTYYDGDTVFYNGATYRYINPVASNEHTPGNELYWDIAAAKGTDPEFITISGDQTFVYSNAINPTPDKESITLSAVEHNFEAADIDRKWEWFNGIAWEQIIGSFGKSLIINHQSYVFAGTQSAAIRYRVGDLNDQMTIVKLYSGSGALTVVITSEYGDTFMNGNIQTTLYSTVYYGGENITSTIPDTGFTWLRSSSDAYEDNIWNQRQPHANQLEIDEEDVIKKATFTCDVEIIVNN